MAEGPGVHNPKVVDLITQTPKGDIVLVMFEERPWDGDLERLMELQNKINHYLAFALDGELVRQYPQAKGKKVQLRLDCSHEPDTQVLEFIEAARKLIKIPFEVNVR